jgi:hypothetical protein
MLGVRLGTPTSKGEEHGVRLFNTHVINYYFYEIK